MSKLFERIIGYIRPIQNGSSSSTPVENYTSEAQVVNSLPRSSTARSLTPWTGNQVGVQQEDAEFSHLHSLLNQLNLARPATNTYYLPTIFPSSNYVFPSSVGLMHYYTHSQHLSHLANGITQPAIVLSEESSPKTEVAVSLAKNLAVVKSVKAYGIPRYQEDALTTMQSQVFLPPSFVKPVYLNDEQFIELYVCAAFINLLKSGAPLTDLVLLQNLLRGLPGKNIANLQYLAAHVSPLKIFLDFRGKISTNLLDSMSPEDVDKLSTVSLSRQASLIHELVAKTLINQQQVSKLSFTGTIHSPRDPMFNSPGYYNNSGNSCPDYILRLNKPVGQYTHMGVDFKFTKTSRGNYDIIKGCSANLENQVIKLNKQLYDDVLRAQISEKISAEDKFIAKALLDDITQNNSTYFADKNLNNYILAHHSLGETYNAFLIRNKVGINLTVPISIDNMEVNPQLKEAFSTSFQHFYLSEESSLLAYLNKTGHNQNTTLVSTRGIISGYADYILSNLY